MGLASYQLNIFAINAQKTQINRQMMAIQDERDIYSAQYDKIVNSNTEWYKDPNVKYLQSREDVLDNELGKLETQLKDIESNLEALEKGRDENLKNGIPSLAS